MRDTLAIILAGGVGSRLNILVKHRAKPAVPFGGIYRIIDFALSNVMNSDLTRVAVLTQYKPLSLMSHIGDGSAWDLSGRTREVKILPPRTGEEDSDWYKGTADAVRQNLDFIESRPSSQILILSGDHVYYMDYKDMVKYHRAIGAKVTVAMMTVPWEQTHQFGIAILDDSGRIIDWEEKPKKAKSNLASMGIYVFDTDYLVESLKTTTETDFGHHILPKAMQDGQLYGYIFKGYWRDVGTIQSYWDAHMDLLDPASGLDPQTWGVVTNLEAGSMPCDWPPTRVVPGAVIKNSAISAGCTIKGTVINSVLSPGVTIEAGSTVTDSIIMHKSTVSKDCVITKVIADKEVFFGPGSHVGDPSATQANKDFPSHLNTGITLIGKWARIPKNASVGGNCIIFPKVSEDDWTDPVLPSGSTLKK
ncbi:MAG: NTP transferase domain-containing protein [Thermodesulfobacteria bacterium]|nr:NTP transferase domain-containing protein [Thermodesulfobacteriota bacterium]